MAYDITIDSGDSLVNQYWDSGENIIVAAGEIISNSEITYRASSLTLREGAVVTGTLTVAAPVTVEGTISASEADLVFDISKRKEEQGLLWSDISAAEANSYTVVVSPNQNKGTYRVAGNAAAFNGTITVKNSGGVTLGTLSAASNTLDFDITRYTLATNSSGELTVTISSNITDDSYYVFLYKNNRLVTPLEDGFGIEVSGTGTYDHLVVIENGIAGDISLLNNGVVTVYAGAAAVGIKQASGGKLRFDYAEGDTTIISGDNQYGSFLVQDNYLLNVVGETVNLSGHVFVEDYHSNGVFTSIDGVDISGVFVSNSTAYFKNATYIHDCSLSGRNLIFEKGVTVTDSTITSGTFNGGNFTNVTITNGGTFLGGTYGDVTLTNGGSLCGHVTLSGTLTIAGGDFVKCEHLYHSGQYIDAAGNTIVLNYKKRKRTQGEILTGNYVSEDVFFCIDLLTDQSIGTYQILGSTDNYRPRYSFTIRTDEGVLGTLTETNKSFEYGNYVYTMNSSKELIIELSPNADETFNVLYWDADDTFYHSVDLFGETVSTSTYKEVIVRTYGIIGDIIHESGLIDIRRDAFAVGIEHRNNAALRFDYTAGDMTIISGANQYGTFLVQDDLLLNVIGESVNLKGNISVIDYRATLNVTAVDGVAFTGTLNLGGTKENNSILGWSSKQKDEVIADVTITNANVTGSGEYARFLNGVTVTDSYISGCRFMGGTYIDTTFSGGVYVGGTYSNVVWTSGTLYNGAIVQLAGTLTITGAISMAWNANIKANYNTIVLDYTNRTVADSAMISVNRVSEDVVFDIALLEDQNVGTYTICNDVGSFIDVFNISIDGDIIGTVNRDKNSFENGNYVYTMLHDVEKQILQLKIDVSENADERFNVLCYDSTEFLTYAPEFTTITIDGTDVAKVVVRNGGWLANTELNSGLLTVRAGAVVYGLKQSTSGKLRFNYNEGDNTIITGVNQYGTFLVENNEIVNVKGENVTVTGDVIIRDYHSAGTFSATGVTVADNFYGNGTFSNSTINDVVFDGSVTITGNSVVSGSTIKNATLGDGVYENVTVTGSATLHSGTYRETVLEKGGLIRGRIVLDGRFTTRGAVDCYESYSVNGAIDAFGYEVNLDLTGRSPIDGAMINVNRVYNADLTVTVYSDQTIGTYTLGSKTEKFGQGDSKGYWDIDTNTWLYKGAVEGDLDGIVTIRSELGVTLANCTVNGDTEYFGRYNYRVYTDENNELQLAIGWNNRENLTFAPDGYDNDLRNKATQLEGTSGKLTSLTIDSKTDVDWFQFTMDVPGRNASSITIDFDMWKGDLDIYLYDEKGNLVDYAKSVTDNEELSLHRLAAGNYYLKVEGYEGNTNEYTLNWNLPHISSLKDDYEAGNNKAHSYHLGKIDGEVVVNGAISDANDEDWFMFILNDDGTSADSISITFDDAEADLEFYIYGSNGKNLIGRGVKHRGHKYCKDDDCHHSKNHGYDHIGGKTEDFDYSDTELYFTQDEISLAGFKHGVYYVRIVSADGGAVDYTLNANILSGEVSPDKWESKGNNNTLKKASHLYSLNDEYTIGDLSIHSDSDEDFFSFTILEDGSADDSIFISYEAKYGDLDIEILDRNGNVVAYSRTAENTDSVSLNGLAAGNYYIRVYGYENTVNNYSLSYKFTNSSLIPADRYESHEPLLIVQSQTIKDLSIAQVREKDETRADVYQISLDYDAWDSAKIILTDFRSDWDGLRYTLSTDAEGKEVIASGISSEISLAGLKKGDYYLTLDTPVENQYSKYSFISQHIPDSTTEIENTWSIFVYIAGDNNLEGAYLQELLYMQHAILPEDVEVYVLMDRTPGHYVAERNWSDTRVGKIRHSPGGAVAVEWMYFDGVNTDTYVTSQNLELQQEWDTGDITTLEAFLDWGMQTGRADNYALIMKDHGTSLGWNTEDETSGSMLHITEIADLLKQEKYDDLSVVTFDQCLMGSDVVITEMENAVEYTVASEAVGWTPNLLVMYKVLFNSLETDMTPEELAGKIVASSNCSGRQDLTLASFDTSNTYLSTALNEFASHASEFTYADWAAVCNSFGTAFNYGDDICAFSDIISILENTLTFTISDTLSSAVNDLMISLKEEIIKATMITPAAYGNGLAVFNPVLSSDNMSMYAYPGGGALDYYGSKIGQMAWGEFLFTVGALAEDVSHYITEAVGELTFTDFRYFFGEEDKEIVINLGAFSGNGMSLEGMYVSESAMFDIRMLQAGIDGDAITIVADNPDAEITLSLTQQRVTPDGIELIVRRVSDNGVLSLAGVDFSNAGALEDYFFVVTTDQATSYTLNFEADWASGVDFFDYSRTGSIDSSRGGNNILDKATKLAPGNYGGLMTYAGDADFYQLNTVYADTLTVTIVGSDLVVKEYDAEGNVIQVAEYSDGVYSLKVTNGNYLYIEGDANPAFNNVNSYTLKVSDVESTFVAAEGAGSIELPTIEVAGNQDDGWTQQGTVIATVSEGATAYYSTDMVTWYELQDNTLDTSVNNRYYFRAVSQTGISKYSSIEFANIDAVAPELTGIWTESAAEGLLYKLTGEDDNLLAGFEYRIGNGDWQQYNSDGVLVSGNTTVDFRAVDAAGNTSEIITRQAVGSVAGDVYGNVGDNGVTIDFSGASSVSGKVYGAGKNTSVSGDINFNAVGGNFDGYVCAGTTADDGEMYQIKGDINMSVANAVLDNGSKSRIYAGGEVSGGSLVRVRGDINITLNDLSVGNMTFGGAKVSEDSEFLLNGSINMHISGGSFGGNLFAGGAAVQNGGSNTISNDVSIVIDGGTFKNIGAGIQCQLGSSAVIRGNTSLTINSGVFNGIVFAGAYSQGGTASVGGNSTLIINGGTFKKSIYGGSFAATYSGGQNGSIKTTVGGDTFVRIDATDSVITFAAKEAIYAGSVDYGVVAGNTNVIISGKGENLIFGEEFTVMGDSIEYQRAGITYIGGNKNMSFDAFTGRFDAQLYAFTHLNIINGSSVEFGVAQNYLGDVSNWKIDVEDAGTALIWDSGRNDFAGDTLDLTFDDTLASATIIDGNQSSVINGWDELDSIIFNGVSGSWSAEYMAWVDSENKWKVFADDNNDLVIAKLA